MAPISKILVSALTLLLVSPTLSAPVRSNALSVRQLHGEGVAADAILTDTDNGVGYGVEDAEDNTANNISAAKGQQGTAAPGGGTRRRQTKRQADKMSNGAAAVLNAAGAPQAGNAVQTNGDNVDGQLTDDAANDGTAVGGMEETTLEQAGSDTP